MPISVSCFAQRTKKELIARKYRSSIEINKLSPLLRYFFPFDIYLIFSFGFRFAIKIFRLKFSNEAPFGQVFSIRNANYIIMRASFCAEQRKVKMILGTVDEVLFFLFSFLFFFFYIIFETIVLWYNVIGN